MRDEKVDTRRHAKINATRLIRVLEGQKGSRVYHSRLPASLGPQGHGLSESHFRRRVSEVHFRRCVFEMHYERSRGNAYL